MKTIQSLEINADNAPTANASVIVDLGATTYILNVNNISYYLVSIKKEGSYHDEHKPRHDK